MIKKISSFIIWPLIFGLIIIFYPISFNFGKPVQEGTSQVEIAQAKANQDTLIILKENSKETFDKVVSFIQKEGGKILDRFPSQVLISQISRNLAAKLKDMPEISKVTAQPLDLKEIRKYGDEVKLAVEVWNKSFNQKTVVPKSDFPPPSDDALFPKDRKAAEGPARGGEPKPASAFYGAGFYDTSEFMYGSLSVSIILPESDGSLDFNTEDWTATQEANVLSEIKNGLNWWADVAPEANLSFTYHFYSGRTDPRARTSYEPINRPSYTSASGQQTWIQEIMNNFGYTDSDYFYNCRSFINDQRKNDKTDWGIIIWVVNSANDPDGRFNDYGEGNSNNKFAYSYYGGPFLVMTYDNGGYGINNMDAIVAHELGHTFYALDQYYAAGKDCFDRLGYLNVENQNSEYNQNGGGCLINEPSIMRGGVAPFAQKAVDYYARGQMGLWDNDKDGILDVIDTKPFLSLSPSGTVVTTSSQYTFSGTASVNPTPNANPYYGALHEYYDYPTHDITPNTISKVEYRVNRGSWTNISIPSGKTQVDFSFTLSNLRDDQYTVEVRAKNSVGNYSDLAKRKLIVSGNSIVTGAGYSGGPQVRIFDQDGGIVNNGFFAYNEWVRNGVKVAVGDVNGDGKDEIVTGTGNGSGPHVRIFSGNGQARYPGFFAYDSKFRGGVNVAVGDLDGDGIDEIITGAGKGGGPQVRVFDKDGHLKITPGFFAYSPTFRGGVEVAAGDVDGDGVDEIITGAGKGGGPQVRVFEGNGQVKPIQFFAFHPNYRGGIDVACADMDGDGKAEIIVSQTSEESWVKVYRYNNEKTILGEFRAYGAGVGVGANVTAGDVDTDGENEIITGPGYGGGPQIRIFKRDGQLDKPGFFAYQTNFRGGTYVAVGNF